MSFNRNPPQTYVPWRPNADFTKFFNDLKNRRISGPDSQSLVRVSDKSATSAGTQSTKYPQPMKVNYSSPSQVLVNTAVDQVGAYSSVNHKKKRKARSKKTNNTLKRNKKEKQTKTTTTSHRKTKKSRLENRLRHATL